jgi:hypothetical protein
MPKATLEFDLNDFDDKIEFARVNKSRDLAFFIWEIMHNTKKKLEWEIEENNIPKDEIIDYVWERLYVELNEKNININELVV